LKDVAPPDEVISCAGSGGSVGCCDCPSAEEQLTPSVEQTAHTRKAFSIAVSISESAERTTRVSANHETCRPPDLNATLADLGQLTATKRPSRLDQCAHDAGRPSLDGVLKLLPPEGGTGSASRAGDSKLRNYSGLMGTQIRRS
jgi:hypothetical protein